MKKIKVLMLVPNLFVANGVASFVMYLTKRATLFIMLR